MEDAAVQKEAEPEPWRHSRRGERLPDHCLDCGALMQGPYCASCGQKNEPEHRSLWQLVKDAVGPAVLLESKLWRTLGALLGRPGELSLAYTEGRRTRYIRPLRLYLWVSVLFFSTLALLLTACGGGASPRGADGGSAGGVALAPSPATPDLPLTGASLDQQRAFRAGDAVFEQVFEPADGLGPVYVRPSCTACHLRGGRGPAQTERMAVVSSATGAPVEALPFGALVRPLVTAGAVTSVLPPDGGLPPGAVLDVTTRVAAPVFGRAYLEAVLDSEIERVAAEQSLRTDEIHGRINRVSFHSQGTVDPRFPVHVAGESGLIGRFGVKARMATLDDAVADALQGDMGLTSALRPVELPNPDGLTDDLLPGVDLPDVSLASLVGYARLLEISSRPAADARGALLFESVGCAVCHVPSLRTRADWPTPQLAGIDAPVFTDLLLHDMGEGLADGQQEEGAGPRDFRTAPLIGLSYLPAYLHDGRASTLQQAVLGHGSPGSEAVATVQRFQALAAEDQDALLTFVGGL